jgi:hypothetical protein
MLEGVEVFGFEQLVEALVAQARKPSAKPVKQLPPLHHCKVGHLFEDS